MGHRKHAPIAAGPDRQSVLEHDPGLRELARCAALAPHAPGAQPWRIDVVGPAELALRACPAPEGAPGSDLRQAVLAAGAALLHLRVAARRAALDPAVLPLPDPGDSHLLALVYVEGSEPAPPGVVDLCAAIGQPDPLRPAPLDASLLAELAEDVALEGAWLHVIGDLVHEQARARAGRRPFAVAVIGTPGDGPHDWLAAGQAFGRIVLRGRAAGVPVWSSFGAVEGAGRHRPALAVLGRPGTPQLLLQIGATPGGT